MKVRELVVKLGLDADEDALDGFSDALGKVKERAAQLGAALSAAAASYTAVGAAASKAATNVLEYSEEVMRNSEAIGLSSNKYQQFRFAFKNLNASTDDMMDAFSTVTDRALDAAEGAVTYRREFERLGISIDELKNKRPGQIFELYMNAAQQAEDQTDKTAAAVRLFGDDLGRRILPALTSSTESFGQLMDRAKRAGVIIPERELRMARQLRMEYRELTGRLNAIWREIGLRVLPIFNEFMGRFEGFLDSRQETEDLFEAVEYLLEIWAEDIRFVIEVFRDLGAFFSEMIGGEWEDHVQSVIVAIKALGAIIISALSASLVASIVSLFSTFGAVIASTVGWFVAIGGMVAFIAAVIQDIIVYLKGGESLIGSILENFGEGPGLLDQIARLAEDIATTFKEVRGPLSKIMAVVLPAIQILLDSIFDTIVNQLKTMTQLAFASIRFVVNALATQFKFVVGLFRAMMALMQGDVGRAGDLLWAAIKQYFLDTYNLFETFILDIVRAFESMFLRAALSGLDMIKSVLTQIPGGFGDGMAKQIDRVSKQMEQRLNPTVEAAQSVPLSGPVSAQGQKRQRAQTAQVARDSFVMFGASGVGATAPNKTTREGDSVEVQQNINVEGEVSAETQKRVEETADEANKSAKSVFEGGRR